MSTVDNIEDRQATRTIGARLSKSLILLLESLKAQFLLFLITGLYILAVHTVTYNAPGLQSYELSLSFLLFMLPILLLATIILRFINICLYVKPKHPIPALLRDIKEFLFDPRRLALGLPVLLALFFLIETFTFMKVNIPLYHPFDWDITFMELDRWLHFGYHPWEILQPVFGYAPVTFLVNVSYNLWFMVMWTIFVWQAFATEPSVLRTRFFVSFLLIWSVGGSIFAVMFSSAGPAYYELLNLSPNPYKELMAYLYKTDESLPIWALRAQEILWQSYTNHDGIIAGISAMPSMHNATAALLALLGWHISRAHGIALTIFAVLIFLGSIHLGWHYAVDAYVGVAITFVVWWFAGKIAIWADNLPAARKYRAKYVN